MYTIDIRGTVIYGVLDWCSVTASVVESKSLNGVTHGDIDNDINITGLYQTRQGGTTCIN